MADKNLTAQIVIGARVNEALSGIGALDVRLGRLGRQVRQFGRGLAELGLGYKAARFFEDALKSAADFQGEMAHVATAVDDGAKTVEHLAEVRKFADDIAKNSVITNAEVAEGYYIARSAMLSHAEALGAAAAGNRLVTATMRDAAEGQQSFEPATRLLADTFKLFGDHTKAVVPQLDGFADTLANLQTKFAFKSIGEIIYGLQYAEPAAKAAGVAFNDAAAALAMLSAQGLHGAEAGTAAEELFTKLATGGKLAGLAVRNAIGGLDVGATMHRLNDMYGSLPPLIRERALTQLGFGERDIRGVTLLMGKWKELSDVHAALDHSQGVAAAKAAERNRAADAQLAILANQWSLLKESLADGLLGPLSTVVTYLHGIANGMLKFTEAYPHIASLALAFLGIAAALISIGGVVQILGVGASLSAAWAAGLKLLTVAQWAMNVAMSANPIGVAVIAAAALVALGYEVYEHWSAVVAVFHTIAGAVSSLGKIMFTAGAHLMAELARGIGSAAMAPVHAIEKMAHSIRAYLPFSPAKVGPLQDLHRTRVVQTIAETMSPSPVVAQMRRVAAAAAIAIPLMISPAFASLRPPPMVSPALAPPPPVTMPSPALASLRPVTMPSPALASLRPVTMPPPALASEAPVLKMASPAASASPITVNFRIDMHGTSDGIDMTKIKAELGPWLHEQGYEIAKIIKKEHSKQARLQM